MSKAKIIAKRSEDNINNEKNILSKINHPFIVNMHFSFQDYDNLYLIMDYLSGGDLRFHLSHRKSSLFTEAQTKFFLSNIIISLEYIHSKKIIHRDVKPENLLLDINGYLRLTDFGIAVYSNKENSQESNGTEGYVAPEVLMQQGYNYSSDYFALGVIGYELMQGNRPFYTGNKNQYKDLILIYQPKIKSNQMKKGWSENSRDFINKLLQRRPIKRLGYNGIRELKNHPWIKDINWELLKNKKIKSPYIPKEGKEYFDKKYCQNDNSHENNKLINVKGYQHVFKNYTFINIDYVSQYVNVNKKNEKKEKEQNSAKKMTLYDEKNRLKYLIYKNKSSSLLKLNKYNTNKDTKKQNVIKEIRKNKHDIKTKKNEKYSSLDNINNNNFLYNSSNFLNRYYDLGISDADKEKNIISDNNYKNISCQLSNKRNKKEKEKKKENKKIISPKDLKRLQNLNLINKYSKKIDLNKSKTNKFVFNKTSNNENDQNIIYSTTKKTTKEKTTNIITENQKKEEAKKTNNKINVINNYKTKLQQKNNDFAKKSIINRTSKHEFSKSQIIINIKQKKNSLHSPIRVNNNKVKKHNIKISTPVYNARNSMSEINNKKNKRYISKSNQDHHVKSVSNISKEKNKKIIINKKDKKTFNSIKKKSTNKISNILKEEKSSIKNNIKKKISSNDSNKIRILKFDDYFRNTGLIKDSNKNSFFVLDKFKSI